jgi:hypothetical protein
MTTSDHSKVLKQIAIKQENLQSTKNTTFQKQEIMANQQKSVKPAEEQDHTYQSTE